MTDTAKLIKLKQQQEKIARQIRLEQARISKQTRADDTRRKILDGALIRNEAAHNPAVQTLLDSLRAKYLTKPQDRALFGLPPLPENENVRSKIEPR